MTKYSQHEADIVRLALTLILSRNFLDGQKDDELASMARKVEKGTVKLTDLIGDDLPKLFDMDYYLDIVSGVPEPDFDNPNTQDVILKSIKYITDLLSGKVPTFDELKALLRHNAEDVSCYYAFLSSVLSTAMTVAQLLPEDAPERVLLSFVLKNFESTEPRDAFLKAVKHITMMLTDTGAGS